MIDTKELRSMVNGAQFESFANSVINALLDRLEAAEKENDALRHEADCVEAAKAEIDALHAMLTVPLMCWKR